MELDKRRIDRIVKFALKEDIVRGDVTTELVISRLAEADAVIICREEGVVCGLEVAERVFACYDSTLRFRPACRDGELAHPGQELAYIEGYAVSIMAAERTALNYLGMMSGTATRTRRAVEIVRNTASKVYDTRKTIPLNRYFQKYAVLCGGGYNHRMGLSDMVLVKDNHLRAYGMEIKSKESEKIVRGVIRKARSSAQRNLPIEIEVETLKECGWALEEEPDIILLDNFSPDEISSALKIRAEKGKTEKVLMEASGGIDMKNLSEYAATGVDRISMGSLTSNLTPLDLSLEIIYRYA